MSDLFIDRSDSRTRIVKELGFSSYAKYLQSPLWQRIKRSAYFHVGAYCVVCDEHHQTFHHSKYTKSNMSGKSYSGLHPICHRCHDRIHFDENRRKLSLAEANKRLKYLSRK